MNFSRAHAFVTGGASGLGAATVEAVLEAGGHASIVDIDGARAEALATRLGARSRAVALDVADEAAVADAVAASVQAFGPLNLVVNCAGVATPGRVVGRNGPLPLEAYARVIQINLVGTFNVMKAGAAAMQGNEPDGEDRGLIVNTASVAAFDGQIGQGAYASSKGGVVALTLPAARELARFAIRVVTIAPGLFETPMLAGLPEAAKESLIASTLHPSRLGRSEEYAALVRHICENPMINGETIRLDGTVRLAPR